MEDFNEIDVAQFMSRKNNHVVGFVLKLKDKKEAEEIEESIRTNFPQTYIINVRHTELPDKIIQVLESEVKVKNNVNRKLS